MLHRIVEFNSTSENIISNHMSLNEKAWCITHVEIMLEKIELSGSYERIAVKLVSFQDSREVLERKGASAQKSRTTPKSIKTKVKLHTIS